MRSFVGNSFHPRLISLAIGSAEDLQAWVQGRFPSITKIPDPTTVRKNYVRFRQTIVDAFARKNYTPKSALVEEPYRHIDYRALVMSPLEAPKVAQPTVGNILPVYLTRDVVQADLHKDAETRLRVIGTSHFFRFLGHSQLLPITHELAVPQWLPFTGEVADSLMHDCNPLLLSAYLRGLFAYPTLPRTILFLRSLVISNTAETDGYIVVSHRYSPCQIHTLGLTNQRMFTSCNFETQLTSCSSSMVDNQSRFILLKFPMNRTLLDIATVALSVLIPKHAL